MTAGTLQIGNGITGNLTGTSGVTASGAGGVALNLADGSTFTPNVVLNSGGSTGGGKGAPAGGATRFSAMAAGTNTVAGVISGTGGFNQNGPRHNDPDQRRHLHGRHHPQRRKARGQQHDGLRHRHRCRHGQRHGHARRQRHDRRRSHAQ